MTDQTIPPLPKIQDVEIKHIPGYPGYAVTDDGRIFSCHRKIWRERKTRQHGKYLFVTLYEHGDWRKKHLIGVSRLVLSAFVGPCPDGMEACHNDGDSLNNREDNLRWDTHKANMADTIKMGTSPLGEKSPMARLTETQVREIRKIGKTLSHRKIAKMFGVEKTTVSNILWNRTWKHVS